MSGICGILWNNEELLCCHVVKQTGIQHWTCVVESYPAVNRDENLSKDRFGFAISCSIESPLKYCNQTCISIFKGACYKDMKIFNEKIPILPILLLITPNSVLVVDKEGKEWTIY
jgi:hypothetical protein